MLSSRALLLREQAPISPQTPQSRVRSGPICTANRGLSVDATAGRTRLFQTLAHGIHSPERPCDQPTDWPCGIRDLLEHRKLQLVPNWNGITMPDTTPMPKATEKILIQKEDIRNSTSRPVTM